MLHTETVRIELPHLIPPYRDRIGSDGHRVKKAKQSKRQYEKRKAAGLCTSTGCREKPDVGHTHCQKHLRQMSEHNKRQYKKRIREGLCIYCGVRPQFWGVRCVICRQLWAKHHLPYGAREALRLYRQAEEQHKLEQSQIDARLVIRKLLASGDIDGKRAKAWRLYAGVDDGEWRTYKEVAKVMRMSKQGVCQLLVPSKITLGRILGGNLPWRPVREDL